MVLEKIFCIENWVCKIMACQAVAVLTYRFSKSNNNKKRSVKELFLATYKGLNKV